MLKNRFPLYTQYDSMDCGPTCLRMISSYYGKEIPLKQIREFCSISNRGVTFLGLFNASKKMHFESICVKIDLVSLTKDVPLPCIIHWNSEHFVVLYQIKQRKGKTIFLCRRPHRREAEIYRRRVY